MRKLFLHASALTIMLAWLGLMGLIGDHTDSSDSFNGVAFALPTFGEIIQDVVETGTDTVSNITPSGSTGGTKISGKIEYFDVYSNSYKPAKNVLVDITGYALDLIPLLPYCAHVSTDQNGNYSWTHKMTVFDVGDVTFKITACAATPEDLNNPFSDCLVKVSAPLELTGYGPALNPYSFQSVSTNRVRPYGSVVQDLKIGGPNGSSGNRNYPSYSNGDEYANAFMLHQEILEHYKKLGDMGFSNNVLTDTEVVVPANIDNQIIDRADIDNSRYNQVLGIIEMALHSYDGTWAHLDPDIRDIDAPGSGSFMAVARHEASHAVHSKIGPMPLNCIDSAPIHSPEIQSNSITGYTEGFAEFLPLVTLATDGGTYECIPKPPDLHLNGYPLQIRMPAVIPPITNHWDWEGDVAALFWDLYDPAGQKEISRQVPAQSIHDAFDLPDIRHLIKWTDRISDPDLSKFRTVLSSSINGFWPVSSMDQFLDQFKSLPGVDLHALKAAGYNRCIGIPGTTESAAAIDGDILCKRQGTNMVKLDFSIVENDSEDRPYVSWQLFKQSFDADIHSRYDISLVSSRTNGAWNGNKWTIGTLLPMPQSSRLEYFWLVVNDEMLPMPYRMKVPTFEETLIFKAKRGIEAVRIDRKIPLIAGTSSSSGTGLFASGDDIKYARAANAAYKAVRAEMQAYVGRQESAILQQRTLYYLSRYTAGIKTPEKIPSELMEITITGSGVESKAQSPAVKTFRKWLTDTAAGKPPSRMIKPNVRVLLEAYGKEITVQIGAQKAARAKVQKLNQQLSDAISKLNFTSQKSPQKLNMDQQVDSCNRLLEILGNDTQLQSTLELNASAIRALAKSK